MTAHEFSITGGTVAVEDGVKAKEEFAPARKVKVELNFSVPEGDKGTEYLDAVSQIAQSKLSELLGKAAVAPVKTLALTPEAPAAEGPKKRGPKPKDKPELSDKEKLAREEIPGLKEADEGEVLEDGIDDLLGDTAPVPVTDAELGKAAQEKNAKMKAELGEKWAPVKIRTLITEFAGEGKRINDIPAAKRHEFLEKLKALK